MQTAICRAKVSDYDLQFAGSVYISSRINADAALNTGCGGGIRDTCYPAKRAVHSVNPNLPDVQSTAQNRHSFVDLSPLGCTRNEHTMYDALL